MSNAPAKSGIKLVLKRSTEEQNWTVSSPTKSDPLSGDASDNEYDEGFGDENGREELEDWNDSEDDYQESSKPIPKVVVKQPTKPAPRPTADKTLPRPVAGKPAQEADKLPRKKKPELNDEYVPPKGTRQGPPAHKPAPTHKPNVPRPPSSHPPPRPTVPSQKPAAPAPAGNLAGGNKIIIKKNITTPTSSPTPPPASAPTEKKQVSIRIKTGPPTDADTQPAKRPRPLEAPESPASPPPRPPSSQSHSNSNAPKPRPPGQPKPQQETPPQPPRRKDQPPPPPELVQTPRRAAAAKAFTDTAKSGPLPLNAALDKLIDEFKRLDKNQIFWYPVSPDDVPDYHNVIKSPMDFETMKKKVASGSYPTITDFENDLELVCGNAMTYNAPRTIFFKEAKRLQSEGKRIIKSYHEKIDPQFIGTPKKEDKDKARKKKEPGTPTPETPETVKTPQQLTPQQQQQQPQPGQDQNANRGAMMQPGMAPTGAYTYSMYVPKNTPPNPNSPAVGINPNALNQPTPYGFLNPNPSSSPTIGTNPPYNNYLNNYLYYGNQNKPAGASMAQASSQPSDPMSGRVPLEDFTKGLAAPVVNQVNNLLTSLKTQPQQSQSGQQHLQQLQQQLSQQSRPQQAVWIPVELMNQINAVDATQPITAQDIRNLLSLQSDGFDVEFLKPIAAALSGTALPPQQMVKQTQPAPAAGKGQIQDILDKNFEGLYSLQLSQLDRASGAPGEQEVKVGGQMHNNLASLATHVAPSALISPHAAAKARALLHPIDPAKPL